MNVKNLFIIFLSIILTVLLFMYYNDSISLPNFILAIFIFNSVSILGAMVTGEFNAKKASFSDINIKDDKDVYIYLGVALCLCLFSSFMYFLNSNKFFLVFSIITLLAILVKVGLRMRSKI